jgi:phage FluMu protein Com
MKLEMDQIELLLMEQAKKRFESLSSYPSVARRFLHAIKRANEAKSVEEVNEVALNCRELLNDYAQLIFSPEFNSEAKAGDTRQLLKSTINHYTKGGRDRQVVSSLNDFVSKVVDELHSITHSSNVFPEHAFMCIELCSTLITSIENLILLSERKGNPIFEYFGVLKCPSCKSLKLKTYSYHNERRDDIYYIVECTECNWSEWTE